MWHELVLNGIGGRTVEEAKQRMTYAEFVSWCAYRHKWGSLHPGMRVDRAIGRAAAFFAGAFSKGRRLHEHDFVPHDKVQHDEQQKKLMSDPKAFFGRLKGIVTKGG